MKTCLKTNLCGQEVTFKTGSVGILQHIYLLMSSLKMYHVQVHTPFRPLLSEGSPFIFNIRLGCQAIILEVVSGKLAWIE